MFGTAEEEAEVVFVIAGSGGGPGGPTAVLVGRCQRSLRFRVCSGGFRGGGGRFPKAGRSGGCHLESFRAGWRIYGVPSRPSLAAPPKQAAQPLPECGQVRPDGRSSGAPVLDDDDDEFAPPPAGEGSGSTGNPLDNAVLRMRDSPAHASRATGRFVGGGLGASRRKHRSGRIRARRRAQQSSCLPEAAGPDEVFAGRDQQAHRVARAGPGIEGLQCSARAWIEHRSLLQSFHGPIRQAWTLGGIINALNGNDPERAKAIALLALASLDQAAVDSGSWLLASEISLEAAPPFGAFARPRVLDQFEAKQSRLLDNRLVSILMSRLRDRDLFHTAKKNLGSGGGNQSTPRESLPAEEAEAEARAGMRTKVARARAKAKRRTPARSRTTNEVPVCERRV